MPKSAILARSPHIAGRFRNIRLLIIAIALVLYPVAGVANQPIGDTCDNPIIINTSQPDTTEASFIDFNDNYNSLCTIGRIGPDVVFQVNVTTSDTLRFTFENLESTANSYQIWVVVGCIVCLYTGSGSGTPGEPETWQFTAASNPYFIIVDADDAGADFQFRASWDVKSGFSPVEAVSWGYIKSIYDDR